MARATHVKKARKDIKAYGIKKGDEYWWASFRTGRSSFKRYWKRPPRPSELTQSEYLSAMYSCEESVDDAWKAFQKGSTEDGKPMSIAERLNSLADDLENVKGDIEMQRDECDSKLGNLPDSLQQAPSGELLQQRVEACENMTSSFEEAIDELRSLAEDAEKDKTTEQKEQEASNLIEGLSWEIE